MLQKIKADLQKAGNPDKVAIYQNFFKTEKGQYGEGDVFLGITMPKQREIAKKYLNLSLKDLNKLLDSKIHEHRMTALVILTYQYAKADEKKKNEIFNFYLGNTKKINNWDLVDVTCSQIIGKHLIGKPRNILYKLAKSNNLWEKRISIISTFAFIRREDFDDSLAIAELLLSDSHDLIHKAVGWTLREIGKKDLETEEQFLKKHYKDMPRTMLRYSIERFEEKKRLAYLKGTI